MSGPLATTEPTDAEIAAEWRDYESRNRRARVEYRLRPSIVAVLVRSLERDGLGRTSQRFGIAPGALAAWFPELIESVDSQAPVVAP